MPGIVGLVSKRPHQWCERQLAEMVKAMHHEGFYTRGRWSNEACGLYVGWTAHENSFADGMPFTNERADKILIFSGEEYPAPGTVRDLLARGHEVEPCGASYLVHLYEEDPSFLERLNGRF